MEGQVSLRPLLTFAPRAQAPLTERAPRQAQRRGGAGQRQEEHIIRARSLLTRYQYAAAQVDISRANLKTEDWERSQK